MTYLVRRGAYVIKMTLIVFLTFQIISERKIWAVDDKGSTYGNRMATTIPSSLLLQCQSPFSPKKSKQNTFTIATSLNPKH